tara:strand:+ start:1208 stop:1693 length:486 start_codon:yes stop_codon:yes gene_type:complete
MSWKDILKNDRDKIRWLKNQPKQTQSTRAAIKRLQDKLDSDYTSEAWKAPSNLIDTFYGEYVAEAGNVLTAIKDKLSDSELKESKIKFKDIVEISSDALLQPTNNDYEIRYIAGLIDEIEDIYNWFLELGKKYDYVPPPEFKTSRELLYEKYYRDNMERLQ